MGARGALRIYLGTAPGVGKTCVAAAVSNDLRSPLASAKAAVSALRSAGVAWRESDRAELEPDPSRPRHLLTEPGLGYRFQP